MSRLHFFKRIAGAAPTFGVTYENAVFDKLLDVTERGVVRALGETSVFRVRELAFEPVGE